MAKLSQILRQLCEQYNLIAIYAFGSRAKEIYARVEGRPVATEHPKSDVDIGVVPVRGRHLLASEKVAIAIALEDAFDVGRVDLVVVPDVKPFLAAEIVRGELLHTTDADAEANFQLYALRRANDLVPFEIERRKMILTPKQHQRAPNKVDSSL
jgi:predicted nucleotidyltransferase